MPPELHISSLLVHVRPTALAEVHTAVTALDGIEVHGSSPQGKIVVTLETASESGIVERLAALRKLPGVLSADLVFHRVEPLPSSSGD